MRRENSAINKEPNKRSKPDHPDEEDKDTFDQIAKKDKKETEDRENLEMDEMKVMLKEILSEIKKNSEELTDIKREMKNKEEKWAQDKNILLNRIEALEERIEKQERDKRRNNTIISGYTPKGENLEHEVEEFIEKELDIKVTPKNVYKINTKNNVLLAVEWETWKDKQKVMENKAKLRSKKQGRPIYIDNHLTRDEQRIQAQIRETAREEKKKNNNVKIGYQKLTVNGVVYRWNKEILTINEEVDMAEIPKND